MKHLITNWQDEENNIFKSEPDDFILPEDEVLVEEAHDRHEQQRLDDADLEALREELKRIARLPLCQKQAD